MDRSLNFIDYLPLFFLLLFTYFYNEYIDIHNNDEEQFDYVAPQYEEDDEDIKEKERIAKLKYDYQNLTQIYNKTTFDKRNNYYIDKNKSNDFMLSVESNNLELAQYLYEKNRYDINQINTNGENALLLCCYWYYDRCYLNEDIIEYLVKNKINVNQKDKNGNTALMKACTHNNPRVIKILLDAGAKVNEKNNEGETAISIAAGYNGFSFIVFMLVEAGANLNDRDKDGNTLLTLALQGERHFWAVYTDTKTYYHDNFFTRFYYKMELLLLGESCCPYHLFSSRFPFKSFN